MIISILFSNDTNITYELKEDVNVKDIVDELDVNGYLGFIDKEGTEVILNLDKIAVIEFHNQK